MASKIRIFRSTGATAPSSLEYGELAVTVEQGTPGTQANKAGRVFIGNASGNPVEIGGEYTYKLMDHVHGELINSSVAIVNSSGQINGWSVAGILTATRTDITDLVTTNLNITGVSTFAGGLNLNGNVTIGDSHTDILTVNSRTGFNTDVTLNQKLLVTGISTFTGAIDANGGANISGGETVLSSATVSDLTDNRVVIAGASGSLEDDGNLTYDGTDLSTNSLIVTDLTNNRVLIAGAGGAVEDDANLTFDGSTLSVGVDLDVDGQAIFDDITVSAASTFGGVVDINNNVTISGTLDVDAQAIFDDVTVSAAMTVTGAVDFNGGLNVSGAETVLSSATVSDLTSGRVVLAGTSGALEDSANLTFDGSTLTVATTVDATNVEVTNVKAKDDAAAIVIDNVTGNVGIASNLTVTGDLAVNGTLTTINSTTVTVDDKNIELASTASPNDTTADGGGITVKGSSDYTIQWMNDTDAWEFNQHVAPDADDVRDLGLSGQEWRNLFVDGLAELDDVNVSAAATIATVDINGGAIDGTIIGAASSAAGTFTTLSATSITANSGRLDAGDVTFTNLRVTGISTVASLFLSTGTNTNGVAFFDANGQVTSTATPSAGIQTSNFILTTNASGVPSWTDTIDGGQF